jgi:hypothetical protein
MHFVRSLPMVLVAACASVPRYDIRLTDVQRPPAATAQFGLSSVTPVKDSASAYRFNDRLISATFQPNEFQINMEISNNGDRPIQILWADAAFVDVTGKSQSLIASDVVPTECSNPKPVSTIIPQSRLVYTVIPCGAFRASTTWGWIIDPFFPVASRASSTTVEALKGKTVRLLLPLRFDEVVSNYIFTFEVAGFVRPSK